MQKEAAYGTWISPITAEMLGSPTKSNSNCDIILDGQTIYWTETRPLEKGRTLIMRRTADGKLTEMTSPEFDVRSKVHEYGGVSYAVSGRRLFFIHLKDQRLYVQEEGGAPRTLTPAGPRFADLVACPYGLLAVREEHGIKGVVNDLVLIDVQTGAITSLDDAHDFCASPCISPDGSTLAWITWDHPNMPWDGTDLWMAEFKEGQLSQKQHVAGGREESIFQPQWSPKGHLFFISDRNGWWNLYRADTNENISPLEAEFGLPMWRLGVSTYGFTGREEEILGAYQQKGIFKLALIGKSSQEIDLKQTDYSQIKTGPGFAVFLMGSPLMTRRLVRLDLETFAITYLDQPQDLALLNGSLSTPEAIEFPTSEGHIAYGFFYPPANSEYTGPKGEKPPLMVISHGGPTGNVSATFNLRVQYWTSRGFAVLDVNYGGSSGYGRAYRERLNGHWGEIDVQDCANGALYLAKRGDIDPERCVIRGGSAGGFTTLAALAFTRAFRAGASYYGVGDLELLARDTHKFESHYLDSLIGPFPERRDLYEARSPLRHADKIACPVIFFQGLKDKVVPPNQAETMVEALKHNRIPTKLVLYAEEEHGFRQAKNIQDSLEQELQFYLDVLS